MAEDLTASRVGATMAENHASPRTWRQDQTWFMESPLFKNDLLTGHEPGRTPGGETPPSTAGGTPAATDDRFMERNVFQKLETYWDHEPWREERSERPSPRPSPGGRGRIFPAGFEGLGRVLAGTGRDGSDGWSSAMSPWGICGSLSPRERGGVREPVSTLAIAATERFMESHLFEIDLLTGHEPGIPGGGTHPSTAGGTPAATEGRFRVRGGAGCFEQPGRRRGREPRRCARRVPANTGKRERPCRRIIPWAEGLSR